MGLRSRRSKEFLPVYKGTRRLRTRDSSKHIVPVDQTENGDVHVRTVKKVAVSQEESEPLYASVTPTKTAPESEAAPLSAPVASIPTAEIKPVKPPKAKKPKKQKRAKKHRRFFRLKVLIPTMVALVVLVGAGAFLFMRHYNQPAQKLARMLSSIKNQAGLSETNPVILTITDSSKVDQPFLTDAKNGDEVVLFYQAGKAVVFRPSLGQVIKVGKYSPPAPVVFLRSGTDGANLDAVATKLNLTKLYRLGSRDSSASPHYGQTMVVDLSQHYPEQAKALAQLLGGTVANLPATETKPDGDILVIVGPQSN